MKNPCIVLEGVVCAGVYNLNCPREFVPFWREIWLERVSENGGAATSRTGPVNGPANGDCERHRTARRAARGPPGNGRTARTGAAMTEPADTAAPAGGAAGEGGAGAAVRTIGRKAGRGLRWSLLGNVVMKAGSFVMSLVLARLLVPEDFGVYAVALAATQFVMTIKDVGIIAATVQWRGRLAEMAPTATALALVSATTLYAVFWVGAPRVRRARREPGRRPGGAHPHRR